MRARLIASDSEEGGRVVLQLGEILLEAMDYLGHGLGDYPPVGSEIEIELTCLHSEEQTWEEMFSGNPGHLRKLVPTGGWSYRVYGCIAEVMPEVRVECGGIVLPAPIQTSDLRCIDTFVAFDVSRLEAWQQVPPNISFERTREG
jgi:hypothetical protein